MTAGLNRTERFSLTQGISPDFERRETLEGEMLRSSETSPIVSRGSQSVPLALTFLKPIKTILRHRRDFAE